MFNRYLLFIGDFYYPLGGICDFRGSYETIEEARLNVPPLNVEFSECDWVQIYDIKDNITEYWDRETIRGIPDKWVITIKEGIEKWG